MSEGYGNQTPVSTSGAVAIGSGGSDGDIVHRVYAGGAVFVVTRVDITMVVAETGEAPTFKFWRETTPHSGVATARAVTFNAGDGTGATVATVAISGDHANAAGDVYRVSFGQDTDSDHIIRPGEDFAVECDNVGTDASTAVISVFGYYQDVGPYVPLIGGAHVKEVSKPGANTVGGIHNLIA